MSKIFLPKDDQRLPDFFTITINYLTGRKETIEVVSCDWFEEIDSYEIWTREDLMKSVPKASIESLDYDKEWSKIVRIKKELKEKEGKKELKNKEV